MKKILFILASCVCLGSFAAKAQTVEVYKNGRLQVDTYLADSVKFTATPQPTSDEARDWAYAHLDSLSDVVWEQMQASTEPNKRDPDATREVFRTIGYNGKNVVSYLKAGAAVDSVILERLIDKALAEGNHTAVLVAGNSGGGKSYSIKSNPEMQQLVSEAGVVLDETFNDKANLEACMARLQQAGIDDQTVILVHNDAKTSMVNAMDRYMRSGRVIGLEFFLYLYPCYVDYVKYLEDNNIGTHRYYLENAGNNSVGLVSASEALKWDYSISDELKQEMTTLVYDYLINCREAKTITPRDLWAILFDE